MAFLAGSDGEGVIMIVDGEGTEARQLSDQVVRSFDWSSDGQRLAFATREDALYVIRSDGTQMRQLVDQGAGPVWSPDDRAIAFFAEEGGDLDVHIVAVDGGGPRQRTDDPADDHSPSWSPEGTRIAFVSERSGSSDVHVVPIDGGPSGRLTGWTWTQASRRTCPPIRHGTATLPGRPTDSGSSSRVAPNMPRST